MVPLHLRQVIPSLDRDLESSSPNELVRLFFNTVPYLMHTIRKEVRSATHSVAGEEMTIPQMRILANLFRQNSTVTQLAEDLGISAPNLSRLVSVLVGRGWLLQTRDSQDRRRVSLALTDNGRKQFVAIQEKAMERFIEDFKKPFTFKLSCNSRRIVAL